MATYYGSPPIMPMCEFLPPASLKRTLQMFCIDLSGTVFTGTALIPGSKEAIEILKKENTKYRFVTNTTKVSKKKLLAQLTELGLGIEDSDVMTSLSVTKDYVVNKKLQPIFLVDDDAMEEFEDIHVEKPDSVVIGLSPQKLNYEMLNGAFRMLTRTGNTGQIVAIHKGRYYQDADGLSLGPGPFVEALEFALGRSAVTMGKPHTPFFNSVVNSCGCRHRASIMIGDDVQDDVIGALKAGMNACLVKTGKYRKGDENTMFIPPGETKPVPVHQRAIIAESLADAVRMLT